MRPSSWFITIDELSAFCNDQTHTQTHPPSSWFSLPSVTAEFQRHFSHLISFPRHDTTSLLMISSCLFPKNSSRNAWYFHHHHHHSHIIEAFTQHNLPPGYTQLCPTQPSHSALKPRNLFKWNSLHPFRQNILPYVKALNRDKKSVSVRTVLLIAMQFLCHKPAKYSCTEIAECTRGHKWGWVRLVANPGASEKRSPAPSRNQTKIPQSCSL